MDNESPAGRFSSTFIARLPCVTEAFNEKDEEFGEQRLIAALQRNRELPASELPTSIVDEVRRFSPQPQQDDIILIVARCG